MIDRQDLKNAVDTLRRGGVILYPTDTIWGIGCDAASSAAVRRVYQIKRRADSKALIALVGSLAQLERTVDEVPDVAYQLMECTDTPLTIIYDRAIGVAPEMVAEDGSLAVRLTTEEFSAALCRSFGRAIVSTSANVSGLPAPAAFSQIPREILDAVDYVCASGREAAAPARPSTIMKISAGGLFKIIRK